MRVEFLNPFLTAAVEVLQAEVGGEVKRGKVRLETSMYTTSEISALVGVVGERIRGMVLYSMSRRTALALVSKMMGQRFPTFDDLAQSGIGELGNVITGRAAVLLAESGYASNLAPPVLLVGRGTMLSTLKLQRLVVNVETDFGMIEVQLVLKEISDARAA